jgi:hypothetical protein
MASLFSSFLAFEDVPPAALLAEALARTRQTCTAGHERLENLLPALAAALPDAAPWTLSCALHSS